MYKEKGFTFHEVLLAIFILSVLVAIGLPYLQHTRAKAFDKQAEITLRYVTRALESYYIENEIYPSCTQNNCENVLETTGLISKGVRVRVVSSGEHYAAEVHHPKGIGTFEWNTLSSSLVARTKP